MWIEGRLAPLPTRVEIAQEIKQLLSQVDARESAEVRESVATWAQKWIINDDANHEYPTDMGAWEMLKALAAADMKDSPVSYLYGKADFEDWLKEIETGTAD